MSDTDFVQLIAEPVQQIIDKCAQYQGESAGEGLGWPEVHAVLAFIHTRAATIKPTIELMFTAMAAIERGDDALAKQLLRTAAGLSEETDE